MGVCNATPRHYGSTSGTHYAVINIKTRGEHDVKSQTTLPLNQQGRGSKKAGVKTQTLKEIVWIQILAPSI